MLLQSKSYCTPARYNGKDVYGIAGKGIDTILDRVASEYGETEVIQIMISLSKILGHHLVCYQHQMQGCFVVVGVSYSES